jgi:hypothetical protein
MKYFVLAQALVQVLLHLAPDILAEQKLSEGFPVASYCFLNNWSNNSQSFDALPFLDLLY